MSFMAYHKNDQLVSRDELHTLPVPAALGTRHVIRPFYEDVGEVIDSLSSIDATITAEHYAVRVDPTTRMPQKFFGALEIRIPDVESEDYAIQLGLRGSYDQSIARQIGVGSRIFVCSNLAFMADVDIKTKQTTNIGTRASRMWQAALEQVPELALKQHSQFEALRNTPLDQRTGDAMLVELVRRQILMPTQLPKALEQWDAPDHAEHTADGRTAWTLQNAVTEAMKSSGLQAMWDRTRRLNDVLMEN